MPYGIGYDHFQARRRSDIDMTRRLRMRRLEFAGVCVWSGRGDKIKEAFRFFPRPRQLPVDNALGRERDGL